VLAVASIRTSQKSSAAVSLLVPIVALALPIVDTLLAMARRGLRGRPVFSGDKEHIHHRLLALGFSHRRVVLVMYGVAVALGALSLTLSVFASRAGLAALVLLVAGGLYGLWFLGFFRFQDANSILEMRRRNVDLRHAVKNISSSLRQASSVEEIVDSMSELRPALKASTIRLDLPGAFVVHREGEPANGDSVLHALSNAVSVRIPVEPGLGHLEIEWTDGRDSPDRDHEIAAETLCRHLSAALERTQGSTWLPPAAAAFSPASIRPTGTRTRRG
jgi:UDP-GlcNAc:undecaprenyl-phosphate GlcNAc-1-phosphate transferase